MTEKPKRPGRGGKSTSKKPEQKPVKAEIALVDLIQRAEALLLDDPAYESRISILAELAGQLGAETSAANILETGKRIRSQLRIACLTAKRGVELDDQMQREVARQNLLEILAQDEALSLELTSAILGSLFLQEEGISSKLQVWNVQAPGYFGSMVTLLKSEMKVKTGKPVQDWQALEAALKFAIVHLPEFTNLSLVVGPAHALAHRATRVRVQSEP